uniref:Uncharacterized protein n=1 Tax=Anguilla anguilla TaxID=7936 RepID=A0A0E9QBV1_ANGAN
MAPSFQMSWPVAAQDLQNLTFLISVKYTDRNTITCRSQQ